MKKEWRKVVAVCAAALTCAVAAAAETSSGSAEWRGQVGACANDAKQIQATISKLSAADQTAFVAAVNEAISKMPGSAETKGAKYLAAAQAAVVNAQKGNRTAIIAEVFATVPPEYLGVIAEQFAGDLMNRNANPARTFTDAEFTRLAEAVVEAVAKRAGGAEDAAVRTTFAIVMMAKASGGEPANLPETLAAKIGDASARERAVKEWLPAALGKNGDASYDAMLGEAQAGDEPDHAVTVSLTGPWQVYDALVSDIAHETLNKIPRASKIGGVMNVHYGVAGTEAGAGMGGLDSGMNRVPRGAVENPESPWHTEKRGGENAGGGGGGGGESGGYNNQWL